MKKKSAGPPETTVPKKEPLYVLAAKGNQDALTQLYEENVDSLYAFVFYRVGSDKTLAEDVVQETFLSALDSLQNYEPNRGTFRTWLCLLSRNIMRKHLKNYQRSGELQAMWDRIDKTLSQIFSALEQSPLSDEVLAREETKDLVHMTIAHLPAHYRSALESRYIEGESAKTLGKKLQLSEEAAKSLLARARRAFREAFFTLSEAMAEVNL